MSLTDSFDDNIFDLFVLKVNIFEIMGKSFALEIIVPFLFIFKMLPFVIFLNFFNKSFIVSYFLHFNLKIVTIYRLIKRFKTIS